MNNGDPTLNHSTLFFGYLTIPSRSIFISFMFFCIPVRVIGYLDDLQLREIIGRGACLIVSRPLFVGMPVRAYLYSTAITVIT